MTLNLILLILMVVAAVWAVVARSLLKAAVSLAIVSIVITIFMFKFNSALAGVFELSVCTGLITVIFLSTIGLTKPMTHKEIMAQARDKFLRYIWLPVLVIVVGTLLALFWKPAIDFSLPAPELETDVRNVLWNLRHLDLFGQIIILLAGGFGAVILFKEIKSDEW